MIRVAQYILLLSVVLPISCYVFDGGARVDLTDQWEFRRAGTDVWRRSTVPGCVHTDLLANGVIPDPFFGSNEAALQWIENEDWEYRTRFRLGRSRLAAKHVELEFAGLDTYASVYLNDSLVLEADNMFRRWRIPCGEILREGANEVVVRFHSPVREEAARWRGLPCELPGGPRVLSRKAAYQYGWDWSPRFVTCGIWRPARLIEWDDARLVDFSMTQLAVSSATARLAADFEIEADDSMRISLVVSVDGERAAEVETALEPGLNRRRVELAIDRPELWWTNGLGEARLYGIRGEIRAPAGEIDVAERRIGVRTVALVEEPDSAGCGFHFELNGVPVYMKGANWVPLDSYPSRATRERYEYFISRAADAGMNMLRVWGGGVYEDDAFYELCDERGILVWQDFMFACAMYPGDSAFVENVEREAVDNVKRLRHHPCVALWCGNNEIEEGWRNWGWQREHGISPADSARIWRDYGRLFHEILPAVVAEHDPGRPYVSTSPRFGRADPRCFTEGDCHDWGVWHDGEPFERYRERVPRFMSEFGFQSFPSFGTIERFTGGAGLSADSNAMRAHQKHPRGNEIIRRYMERSYRVPEDFRQFAYVSQLVQAEGVRLGIEAERRSMPHCMGSLFWQFNDCWPAVSWSCIDYDGVPKALYHFAREAFAPVLVSPVIEDGTIGVWIVSDLPEAIRGELDLEVRDFAGGLVWARRLGVEAPGRSSARYVEEAIERALDGRDEREVFLDARFSDGNGLVARKILYFAAPKELDLPSVNYVSCTLPVIISRRTAAPSGRDERYAGLPGAGEVRYCSFRRGRMHVIEIESDVLVKNLRLDAGDWRGNFSNNYFDVVPGERVTVTFTTNERRADLFPYLRLVSLVDTYRAEE